MISVRIIDVERWVHTRIRASGPLAIGAPQEPTRRIYEHFVVFPWEMGQPKL